MVIYVNSSKYNIFDASLLSSEYANKTSLSRYKELINTFPNTLIIFEHADNYYGFDETAVALYYLFGCCYYKKNGMLVSKIEAAKFEEHFIAKRQMRGFRYVIDRNGILTFEKGTKGFSLQKPLSYYFTNIEQFQRDKSHVPSYDKSYSRHGAGWHDDVWAPGLSSQRF